MKRSESRTPEILALLLYAALIITSACFHEPWRDEAQAWLIARDLPVPGILSQVAYEGAPGLWHLLLAPLAQGGAPYASQLAIHVVIAIVMTGVFLFLSPFSLPTRLLVSFSYYMAFEYAVIARNYSLSILFLFLLAAFYDRRFTRPVLYAAFLALLFNTSVHSLGMAGALFLLYAFEAFRRGLDRGTALALGVMTLGAVLCMLQIKPHPDNFNQGFMVQFVPLIVPIAVKHAFFPTVDSSFAVSLAETLAAGAIFLAVFLYLVRKPAVLFFLLLSQVWLLYIFVFKHIGGLRHHGFLFVATLVALWIAGTYPDKEIGRPQILRRLLRRNWKSYSTLLVNLSLVVAVLLAAQAHFREITLEFSGAKRMASFIKENQLQDRIIAAHLIPHAGSLLPFLPGVRFWYPATDEWGTYTKWDNRLNKEALLSPPDVIRTTEEKGFPRERLLVLLSLPLENPEALHYQLLFKADERVFGTDHEVYYLYAPSPPGAR